MKMLVPIKVDVELPRSTSLTVAPTKPPTRPTGGAIVRVSSAAAPPVVRLEPLTPYRPSGPSALGLFIDTYA